MIQSQSHYTNHCGQGDRSSYLPFIFIVPDRVRVEERNSFPRVTGSDIASREISVRQIAAPVFFYCIDLKFLYFNHVGNLLPFTYHSYRESQNNIDVSRDHTGKNITFIFRIKTNFS